MLATYMNHQLTRLDVATTEDGYLLTINQVIEFKEPKTEKVEAFIERNGFKPIIMEKIEWGTPAQPAVRADYFSSLIGPGVNTDKVAELIDKMQNRVNSLADETFSHVYLVLLEMAKVAKEATGMIQPLTKREALLMCMAFKTAEACVCGKYKINK